MSTYFKYDFVFAMRMPCGKSMYGAQRSTMCKLTLRTQLWTTQNNCALKRAISGLSARVFSFAQHLETDMRQGGARGSGSCGEVHGGDAARVAMGVDVMMDGDRRCCL